MKIKIFTICFIMLQLILVNYNCFADKDEKEIVDVHKQIMQYIEYKQIQKANLVSEVKNNFKRGYDNILSLPTDCQIEQSLDTLLKISYKNLIFDIYKIQYTGVSFNNGSGFGIDDYYYEELYISISDTILFEFSYNKSSFNKIIKILNVGRMDIIPLFSEIIRKLGYQIISTEPEKSIFFKHYNHGKSKIYIKNGEVIKIIE